MLVAVGITARTVQRALSRDLDGQQRRITTQDSSPSGHDFGWTHPYDQIRSRSNGFQLTRGELSTNRVHRTRRCDELRAIDLMPDPFLVHGLADGSGNRFIGRAIAK